MGEINFRQIYAIKKKNEAIIRKYCPDITDQSGIYILTRFENGFKYCYVGQARKLLSRLADHLNGYQHIDLSLKKHKFYSKDNPTGWKIEYQYHTVDKLDELEQLYIKEYAAHGYQMRNKTAGGQGEGKFGINESRQGKGYYDGKKQGYLDAQKYVAHLFELHLKYDKKSEKPNKNQEKAMQKFADFLNWEGKSNG